MLCEHTMGAGACINWERYHPDVKIGLVGTSNERVKGDEVQMTAHVQIVKSQALRPQELHAFHAL